MASCGLWLGPSVTLVHRAGPSAMADTGASTFYNGRYFCVVVCQDVERLRFEKQQVDGKLWTVVHHCDTTASCRWYWSVAWVYLQRLILVSCGVLGRWTVEVREAADWRRAADSVNSAQHCLHVTAAPWQQTVSHHRPATCILLLLHTHTRLTALCPGLPGWAGTRKVKPIWILLKQETVGGSGISWTICKSAPHSRQITTPAPNHSVFYRPDALPATQPTASKHWRPYCYYYSSYLP